MTAAATNMSTPVTRGELKSELEQLEIRFDQKLERLEERLDQKLERLEERLEEKLEHKLEQKLDYKLGLWGGALRAQIEAMEQRLLSELARHIRAVQESMPSQIAAVDEKYKDLPSRVKRLEATVFRPRRR